MRASHLVGLLSIGLATACADRAPPVAVVAGIAHSCALERDGRVWCWGSDRRGQLGSADTIDHPFAIRGRVRAVAAGGNTTCVVDMDGAVWCAGQDDHGQLGDARREDRSRPVKVAGVPPASSVAVGYAHACALTEQGEVWCWGWGAAGQAVPNATVDVDVPARAGVVDAVAVSAGFASTCAIDAADRVFCWGGTFGDATTALAEHARALALGTDHVCVLRADELRCFGVEPGGARGPLPLEGRSYPFAAGELASGAIDHACATDADGAACCMGKNFDGQLGTGDFRFEDTLVRVRDLPIPVTSIAVGEAHSCAVAAGDTWCWGANGAGQLGDGTTIDSLVPVLVPR